MTTKTERASSKQMLAAGYSYKQIGDFFDVRPETVRGWHDPEFKAAEAKKFAKRSFRRNKGWA